MSRSYCISLLTCLVLLSSSAFGQVRNPCDALLESVEHTFTTGDLDNPDVLLSMATYAREGRQCYGTSQIARVIGLLNRETWALDQLGRYDEAESLIDLFYRRFENASNDEYRAEAAALDLAETNTTHQPTFASFIQYSLAQVYEAQGATHRAKTLYRRVGKEC